MAKDASPDTSRPSSPEPASSSPATSPPATNPPDASGQSQAPERSEEPAIVDDTPVDKSLALDAAFTAPSAPPPGSQATAARGQASSQDSGQAPRDASQATESDAGESRSPAPPIAGAAVAGGRRRRSLKLLVAYPLLTAAIAAGTGIGVAASIDRPQVETLDDFVPKLVTHVYDRQALDLLEAQSPSQAEMTAEDLAEFVYHSYSRENRTLLAEGELPPLLQNAILATEDANFFKHGGIDLKSIARAIVKNLREGRRSEGASTITMQLARDVFQLSREKQFKRKIEEALLAVELEKKFSKQQILTMYANMINLGHGNYGMEAAARNYFNKSVADLSLAEAATLAGIPQRPSDYSVYRRPDLVVKRRNIVLGRMAAVGAITPDELASAREEPLRVTKRRKEILVGPYFAEEVRRYLISTYGETELYDRGLRAFTTMDRQIQDAADRAVLEQLAALDHEKGWRGAKDHIAEENLDEVELPSWFDAEPEVGVWYEGLVLSADRRRAEVRIGPGTYELTSAGIAWTRKTRPSSLLKPGDVAWFRFEPPEEGEEPLLMLEQEPEMEAAVLVIESSTGAVRAMVGGWNFERNEFNRATQARRQIGSSFKPFVFGAALENGYTAADTLFDGPVVFPGGPNQPDYSPRNFYRRYEGILTLRRALELSINVTSVKLLDLVGFEQVIDFSRRCGIESELPPYASLALGTSEMTPLELAAAYSSFVNQGVYVQPYFIERVASRNGRTMYEHQPQAHKAMDPAIAYVITDMLRGVAVRGTGATRLAKIGIPTAGKTGTTDSYTDAWFVGFTPRYTILSWVGYDKKRFLGRGMTGAHAALPIWAAVVERGLEDGWLSSDETFAMPPGVLEVEIDQGSGLLAGAGSERVIVEAFVEGSEPKKRHDLDWARIMAQPWYLQEPFYLPKEGERMPAEISDWSAVKDVWKTKDEGPESTPSS
ncbi:MAG: PBP1A family penicillin-binding protein [Acidobacteriota bacterium]